MIAVYFCRGREIQIISCSYGTQIQSFLVQVASCCKFSSPCVLVVVANDHFRPTQLIFWWGTFFCHQTPPKSGVHQNTLPSSFLPLLKGHDNDSDSPSKHASLIAQPLNMWILPLVGYIGLGLGFGFLTLAIGTIQSLVQLSK